MRYICGNCFFETRGGICRKCGYRTRGDNPPAAVLPIGTMLAERYIIGRVIGKGGFGITYLAYDTKIRKTIAVKEYFPDGTAVRFSDNKTVEVLASIQEEAFRQGTDKFYHEAEMIASFAESADILSVYNAFRENGTAYYTMEFVRGITLNDYVEKYGTITEQNALYIVRKICLALRVLHKSGFLHRDVSPDNIMICANGGVKLLDFGAARQFSNENGQNLSVMLKLGFTPFEQYQRNGKQGPWTDIYSLGASLFYALTGSEPDDPMTRLDDDSPFMNKINDIPDVIRGIVVKAAAIAIENRFSDSEEMLSTLNMLKITPQPVVLPESAASNSSAPAPRILKKRTKIMLWISAALAAISTTLAVLFLGSGAATSESDNLINSVPDDIPKEVKIGTEFYSLDLTSLDLADMKLSNANIPNLQHLTKLKYLNLDDNFLTDLSPLGTLTELEELHFNNNNVQDIEFTRGMTKLRVISGENNGVSDLSPLADKVELEAVFFGDNLITDISPLKNCMKLKSVGMNRDKLRDLSPLADKTMLTMLCMTDCGLSDISPLSECIYLDKIYFGQNPDIKDFSPLRNCVSISELFVDCNEFSDETIESFDGLRVYGIIAAGRCGLTKEEADRIISITFGNYNLEY